MLDHKNRSVIIRFIKNLGACALGRYAANALARHFSIALLPQPPARNALQANVRR